MLQERNHFRFCKYRLTFTIEGFYSSYQHAKRDRMRADLSAARLVAFIASAHAHEDLLQQRLRDLEGKQVLEVIARMSPVSVFTTILPSDPTHDLSPPPTEVVARLAPVDLTKLPVLGDYR